MSEKEFLYSNKATNEIVDELSTSVNGLTEKEAVLRLSKFGSNEIRVKKVSAHSVFARQFKNPFIYLLFGAAIIALFLKEFVDIIVILAFLIINGSLGFYQEYKSEKLIEKLKSFIRTKAKVYRDGKLDVVDKSGIVMGDLILIEKGDVVPADMRLIKSHNLTIDESILTGESKASRKDFQFKGIVREAFQARNLTFWGTNVISGSGEGIVIATGMETQVGKISELAEHIERKSGFEIMVLNFSKFVLKLVIVTLIILFGADLILKGSSINMGQTLLFILALAVSVVPEALPIITTITLSKGALNLAKKNVVVKRLSSLEDLGNIEVLCSDKTGTITKNELELQDCLSLNKQKCFSLGIASCAIYNTEDLKESPFDFAIWQKSDKQLRDEAVDNEVLFSEPFDPEERISSIVLRNKKTNEVSIIIKGAPEAVFSRAQFIFRGDEKEPFSPHAEELSKQFIESGKKGYRVLAIATKKVGQESDYAKYLEDDFIFAGMFTFYDPLKPTAKEAISRAKKLNVEVKIITGDSLEVAEHIARQSGILGEGEKGVLGSELDEMNHESFSQSVLDFKVFARISPEQKYKIIQEIQKTKPVGFLGEGINDAPALKLANVAIVVDSASDVAKEVADVILLHKDLKVVIDGISEGRKIYTNVIKYIKYTLAGNFGNFYTIAGISLMIPYLPMLPTQILLTNILSDLPLIAVADDNVDSQELKKPSHYNIRDVALISIILGLVSSLVDFVFFGLFFRYGEQNIQTMWFIESILAEIILIFSIRSRLPIWKAAPPSKTLVLSCAIASIVTVVLPFTDFGQKVFHFVGPTGKFVAMVMTLVILYFAVTEMVKIWYYRAYFRNNKEAIVG